MPTKTQAPTFDPELSTRSIKPHPSNPRRTAIADDEMVASIKEAGLIQPLIVAPAAKGTGYVVLAGHRRLDGVKKAKVTKVPAIIRHDITTDAEQIEFAVIENVHRQDLTPVEEAEAFEQLRSLKYTQADIARKTGRPVSQVRDRLKLIKLSTSSRDALHRGQLTIGDALALTAFSDDPETETRLAKSPNLSWAIAEETRKREFAIKAEQARAEHLEKGLQEVPWPAGKSSMYELRKPDPLPLHMTAESAPSKHKDCLGFMINTRVSYETSFLVCTAPHKHKKTLSAAERKAKEAEAQRQAELHAAREAAEIAQTLRTGSVFELIGQGITLDPRLRDLLRALLPSTVWLLDTDRYTLYSAAMVGDDDLWGQNRYNRSPVQVEAFQRHASALNEGSDPYLLKALSAVLLSAIEDEVDDMDSTYYYPLGKVHAARYFDLLEGIGHELSDADKALAERARAAEPVDEAAGPGDDDSVLEAHAFAGEVGYACIVCDMAAPADIHQAFEDAVASAELES
ncbi:MAG: ParB/RepB/Spo0J family partition protein [Actinobacteria bacterium]|uniref:Unannotated protein n=1 Tax=freshwater metagenome TaxID=449393 RepID=A0A6J6SE88_9ZZZZ|nr:ParB/RepB/Spo0J family partition protein [Actinomycetota bacterium]